MHEFALAARIVGIAADKAVQEGHAYAPRIELIIDEMSGCSTHKLELYFEFLSEEAGLAGARLLVTTSKARMECLGCGVTFERQRFALTCPACQATAQPSPADHTLIVDNRLIQADITNPLSPFVTRPEQKKDVHPTPTPQGPTWTTFFCNRRRLEGECKDQ